MTTTKGTTMTTYTITNWERHRNGVSGTGFYTVAFTLTEDGDTHNLIAVMPDGLREHNLNDGDTPCFVINPADPLDSHWRGDRIAHDLISMGIWQMIDDRNEATWQAFLKGGVK